MGEEPLPLGDDSVDELYSSHVLQGVKDQALFLHEIVRVCRPGAHVELRAVHWLSSMALCPGHLHTISPTQVRHWCNDFVREWWAGCKKRLRHLRTEFIAGEGFGEAKDLLGWFTDEQIMRLIPNSCHECRYHFDVIAYEDPPRG